jgi:beta-galactosidase
VTEQTVGRGKAVHYGSLFNLEAARYLVKRYVGEVGLKPLLADVPRQVEVTRRTKGETDFYFLLNHGDTPVEAPLGEGYRDALSGEAAPMKLTLAPFGYQVLKRERRGS